MKATTGIDGEPPRSQATWFASLAPALSALASSGERLQVGRLHPSTGDSGPFCSTAGISSIDPKSSRDLPGPKPRKDKQREIRNATARQSQRLGSEQRSMVTGTALGSNTTRPSRRRQRAGTSENQPGKAGGVEPVRPGLTSKARNAPAEIEPISPTQDSCHTNGGCLAGQWEPRPALPISPDGCSWTYGDGTAHAR